MPKKTGYEGHSFRLDDYPDPLDLQIFLKKSVRKLRTERVKGVAQSSQFFAAEVAPIYELEKSQGMQFDLQEHIAFLPGISGMEEFSSNLSHFGSRTQDVANYLGEQRIPLLRHIDIGFPGNLSAINPRVLEGISLSDAPGEGPLDQGLSAALQYKPRSGDEERFGATVGVGTTLYELTTLGPWFNGGSHLFSFRILNSAFLSNLGSRFFTEYRKRDTDAQEGDDLSRSGSDFDLLAFDLYGSFSNTDSSGNLSQLSLLWLRDEWKVMQDTATTFSSDQSGPRLNIFSGDRDVGVLSWRRRDVDGWGLSLGAVIESSTEEYRDDATVIYMAKNPLIPRRDGSDNIYEDPALLGRLERVKQSVQMGGDYLLERKIMGAGTVLAVDGEWVSDHRSESYSPQLKDADLSLFSLRLGSRFAWNSSRWKNGLSLGAIGSSEGELGALASATAERKLGSSLRWQNDAGWRSQLQIVPGEFDVADHRPTLEGKLFGSSEFRSGLLYEEGRLKWRAHGFTRWYPHPQLPVPEVLWFFNETRSADYAWIFGGNMGVDYSTLHHWLFSWNATTVRGDYYLKDGGAIPWEAQRHLDMVSAVRFFPLNDTLISVILRHRASWGKPTYIYHIDQYTWEGGVGQGGTRSIAAGEELTTFRTDLRLHLDLATKAEMLKSVRVYLEVNNLFAAVESSAFRWLGGANERQRGWEIERLGQLSDQRFILEPYVGRGMGLFFQFGVEGNF